MVKVGSAAGIGQKEIQTEYPVEEGLTFGTQTQKGRVSNLVVQERSLVPQRERRSLRGNR